MSKEVTTAWKIKLLEAHLERSKDIVLITEAFPLDAPRGPRIIFANPAIEHVTGYTVEEVTGQTPRMFQGPLTQEIELRRIRQALEAKKPIRTELINYTKSGETFWLEVDISPVSLDHGQVTHFIAVQRDISKRKKAQSERELADERFRLITGATKDVVWDWNVPSDEVWRSENYRRQFGHAAGLSKSGHTSWSENIAAEDRERVLASMQRFLHSNSDNWAEEYRFADASGRYIWVADRAMVVRNPQGHPLRLIGIMADITERRELEDRLAQAQRLESLGKLTGGIAHDFNNLLTVLLGNSEYLSENVPEGPLKEVAELSLSACQNGSDLVARLLTFARRQALAPVSADLNRQLARSLPLLARTLPESIDIRLIPAPDIKAAKVDLAQFDSAILNLCLNARDAMPDGGEITIDLTDVVLDDDYAEKDIELQPGDYVMVTVTDTGEGMTSETVERAFEPFYTTKAHGAGSGLGLSTVYGFMKQSGGHVSIYSEPGVGTAVRLYFPTAETLPQELRQDAVCSDGGLPPIKVLIVEDNAFVLAHAKRLLSELGLKSVSATNAKEALDLIKDDPDISLLFTDIILPGGVDGVSLASQAASLRPDLPVLFTTGYTTSSIVVQERFDKSVSVLTKPYRKVELITKIRAVLDNQAVC